MASSDLLTVTVHDSVSSAPEYREEGVSPQCSVRDLKGRALMHFRLHSGHADISRLSLTPSALQSMAKNTQHGPIDMVASGDVGVSSIDVGVSGDTDQTRGSQYVTALSAGCKYSYEEGMQHSFLVFLDNICALSDELTLGQEKLPNEASLALLMRSPEEDSSPPPSLTETPKELLDCEKALNDLRSRAQVDGWCMPPVVDEPPATPEQIMSLTANMPRHEKPPTPASPADVPEVDQRPVLRRVYLGVAHSCMRLLGDAATTCKVFTAVLEKLEKRHKSGIQPQSIKSLLDLGISEPKAVMALKLKNNIQAAAEWLLAREPQKLQPPGPPTPPSLTDGEDPIEALMPHFWHLRRNYFTPNVEVYNSLISEGFSRDLVFDALMQAENLEGIARQLLTAPEGVWAPLPRSHPIMAAVLDSPSLHCTLHRPKLLYAVLALCENPGNSNLWLSDPDTSAVVRLVIKSHHEERFNADCFFPAATMS